MSQKSIFNRVLIVLALLLVLSTLIFRYTEPLRDGDLWWQMVYGKYFLANNTLVPDHTVFTWTNAGHRMIYCAWFSEILLYLMYQAFGLPVLLISRYVSLFLLLYFLFRFAQKKGVADNILIYFIMVLALLMSYAGTYIKPEIFSYVYLIVSTALWWRFKNSNIETTNVKIWEPYLLPLIMLLWVNSHGGWVFGYAYFNILLCGEAANKIFKQDQAIHENLKKHVFIALALCSPAIFVTPYGYKYPYKLFETMFLKTSESLEKFSQIAAYRSVFDPTTKPLHYHEFFYLAVGLFLILFILNLKHKKLDFSLIFANIVFAWLYTKFLRTTYFWAPIFSFSAIHLLSNAKLPSKNFITILKRMLVMPIAVLIIISWLTIRTAKEAILEPGVYLWFGWGVSYQNPVHESEYIKNVLLKYDPDLIIGNTYDAGGYLMWDLWPDKKIYIDPRQFPFKKWMDKHSRFEQGFDFQTYIDENPCDIWCVNLNLAVVEKFTQSPDWEPIYFGPVCGIFIKKALAESIKQKGYHESVKQLKNIRQVYDVINFCVGIGQVPLAEEIIENAKTRFSYSSQQDKIALLVTAFGKALLKKGYLNQAVDNLEAAIQIKPDLSEGYVGLCSAFIQKKLYDDAIEPCTKALEIEPDLAMAHANLGIIYAKLKNDDKAITHFQKAVNIETNNARLKIDLGRLLLKSRQFKPAIDQFKDILKNDPQNQTAQNYLNTALTKQKELEDGIQKLKTALVENPDDVRLNYQLGVFLQKNQEDDAAILSYNKTIEIEPSHLRALNRLAGLYVKQKKYDLSISTFEKMIKIKPALSFLYYNVACLYIKKNEPKQSFSWLKKAVENGYNNWDKIKTDKDLDGIRHLDEFKAFLKENS